MALKARSNPREFSSPEFESVSSSRYAARALAQLLLGNAPAGVYNVAVEDTRPLRSFIEEIYDLCGRKGSYVYGDRPPNAEGVISLQPDLTKLKEAAGWKEQVDFAEGIRRMIKLRRKDSET